MFSATFGSVNGMLEFKDYEILFDSKVLGSLSNLSKIEIIGSQMNLSFGPVGMTLQLDQSVENVVSKLKSMSFIMISKAESIIFLPMENKVFPSDFGAKDASLDVEELGWNVLEKFSHVTRFAKDLIKQDKREPSILQKDYDYQIISKFSIDSSKFKQDLNQFISSRKSNVKISEAEIKFLMDENGVFRISEGDWKEMVFNRGLEDKIRPLGWMILLKVFNKWDASLEERELILDKKKKSYSDLKQHWQELLNTDLHDLDSLDSISAAKLNDMKHGIIKDILRTDRDHEFYQMESEISPSGIMPDTSSFNELSRGLQLLYFILMTYSMYNLDLGYVQGMNDLLSPIALTVDSEEFGFWCFVGFMDKMQKNFSNDQLGIKQQLHHLSLLIKFMDPHLYSHLEFNECNNMFICYRWILVSFKREFCLKDLTKLWERVWASNITHFGIFIAFAMLNINRSELLKTNGFDDLLRFINDSSLGYDVNDIIWRSKFVHDKFKHLLMQILPSRLQIDVSEIYEEKGLGTSDIIETECSDDDLKILIELIC